MKNYTPLQIAVMNSAKDMIEILLSQGSNINAKNCYYHNLRLL